MTYTFKSCWDILEIAPTQDGVTVRKAYASQLKKIDTASSPELFQTLRDAFDEAKAQIKYSEANSTESSVDALEDLGATNLPMDDKPEGYDREGLNSHYFRQATDISNTRFADQKTDNQREISEILSLLEDKQLNNAVNRLKEVLQAESCQSVDDRFHLSGQLLLEIEELSQFPHNFYQAMVVLFGWEEYLDNPFQYDSPYFGAYERCRAHVYGDQGSIIANQDGSESDPPYFVYGILCYIALKAVWLLLERWELI